MTGVWDLSWSAGELGRGGGDRCAAAVGSGLGLRVLAKASRAGGVREGSSQLRKQNDRLSFLHLGLLDLKKWKILLYGSVSPYVHSPVRPGLFRPQNLNTA